MPKTYEEACRIIAEKIKSNEIFVAHEFDGLPKNDTVEQLILAFSTDGIAAYMIHNNISLLFATYDAILRIGVLIGLEMRRDESIDELIRSASENIKQ